MGQKERICQLVDKSSQVILDMSDQLWQYAEPGMKEHQSASYLVKVMKAQGFSVDAGVAGIPTAFVASWGQGKPVIGFLGEYDALPGLSQQAGKPEKYELVPGAYGQGCGHNCLGAGAAGAALALRDYMKENQIAGTVRYYGCPGEEYGSGKAFMAREGLFDDVDACFTWHPNDMNSVAGASSLADLSVFYKFTGRTAHAAGSPHLGRSALDACELMSVGVNYLREHMPKEDRVHYAYVDAGGTAPNVVQDHAKVHYFIRAPKVKGMMELYERVNDVARGAALMTGTQVEIIIHEGLSDYLPSRVLDQVSQEALEEIGAPPFDDQDLALAQEFRKTFSEEGKEGVFQSLQEMGVEKGFIPKDAALCQVVLPYYASDKASGGSTDVGDVSYCAPTSQFHVATMAIATPGHSWQTTAQSCSSLSHKGTLTAAKAMALAAAKVLDRPEVLKRAKEELVEKTGGKYICPMPDSVKPLLE